MTPPVKPRSPVTEDAGQHRPVRSTYRQVQAAATRARIASAARRLFAEDGYRPTSMDAIAQAAGVAPRTVYTVFGAKREILSTICERWLEEAHAQDLIAMAIGATDPMVTIRLAALFLRSLFQHGYDVVTLFDAASDDDPQTRELLRGKLQGRNQAQDAVIATMAGQLITPLPAAQAIYRALAATGIYRELVVESGWSDDDFEDWIADALSRQLLGVGVTPRPDPWPPALVRRA